MGFVGFLTLVVGLHRGFGLLPAILVLSVIVIPYITKAVESSLSQVPVSYREGAEALGIPEMWTLRKIVLKAALPGIVAEAGVDGEQLILVGLSGRGDKDLGHLATQP